MHDDFFDNFKQIYVRELNKHTIRTIIFTTQLCAMVFAFFIIIPKVVFNIILYLFCIVTIIWLIKIIIKAFR